MLQSSGWSFFLYFANMKSILKYIFSLSVLLAACNGSGKQADEAKSDNDMDAARNFLEEALKGDFSAASGYMLRDSTNAGYLNIAERIYKGKPPGEKDSLKSATLRFYDTRQVNDSTTITVFANSYKNKKDTLKIVRRSGQWLVDLKYLFEHDMDTTNFEQHKKIDTIQK